MRAILIDPRAKTVEETECDGGLQDIYRLTQCDTIDAVRIGERDTIYVDDNGLVSGEPEPFFMWADYPQPLAGRGLILAIDDEGETIGTELDIVLVRASVSFPAVEFTGMSTTHEDNVEMPWGGTGFRVNIVPHFRPQQSPGIWRFPDTGTAYDACQTNEAIASGDMLIIEGVTPGETVVGLAGAWPVAVTNYNGHLHKTIEGKPVDAEFLTRFQWTEDQVRDAVAEAKLRGAPISPAFLPYAPKEDRP